MQKMIGHSLMRCHSDVTVVCFSLRLALEAGVEEDWNGDLMNCVVIWVYICMEPWPCLDPCGKLIIPLQSRYDLSAFEARMGGRGGRYRRGYPDLEIWLRRRKTTEDERLS